MLMICDWLKLFVTSTGLRGASTPKTTMLAACQSVPIPHLGVAQIHPRSGWIQHYNGQAWARFSKEQTCDVTVTSIEVMHATAAI